MRHLGIVGLLVLCTGGWAQTAQPAPDIKVPTAVSAPASSVDLLKQAVKTQSPFASPSQSKPPQVPRPPRPAVTTTTSASSTNTRADTTLQMPLTMGGSSTTVQTVVAPAVAPKPAVKPAADAVPAAAAQTPTQEPPAPDNSEESSADAADAPDAQTEYAVKMLEKSKPQQRPGARIIPPAASKNRPSKVPSPNKKFNPNAYRPGVVWVPSKSTHFDIYTQKPEGTIGSANLALAFESAYDTLRRFIPWMMSGRVRVFVYQDQDSYLRYEPEAKIWSRAVAYPTRGEIVVYDEPGKTQELKEVFAHELTHIFTQQFFDKHQTGRMMVPTWLDEGLAVLVEDQMVSGKGGPWDHDYRTLQFMRDPKTMPASFASNSMFGGFSPKPFTPISQRGAAPGKRTGKPVRLAAFDDFMQDSSLDVAEATGKVQNWYLQAYLMVRFLLNPAGGSTPSNRLQFEQFTNLMAQGEAVRNPSTGFLMKDARGKQIYEPYSVEKALGRAYRYNTIANFEDNFWKWLK